MKKVQLKASTYLCPVPAALVSCQDKGGRPNIITIAWTGVVCSDPPMLSISIRPSRYSHGIIKEAGEFVVNIPSADIIRKVDLCGIISGRDSDKFEKAGLTPLPASHISAPLIKECPINMECRLAEIVPLGVHDMFLGEIVATHINEDCVDDSGKVNVGKIDPLAYIPPDRSYRSMGDVLGSYGFARKE